MNGDHAYHELSGDTYHDLPCKVSKAEFGSDNFNEVFWKEFCLLKIPPAVWDDIFPQTAWNAQFSSLSLISRTKIWLYGGAEHRNNTYLYRTQDPQEGTVWGEVQKSCRMHILSLGQNRWCKWYFLNEYYSQQRAANLPSMRSEAVVKQQPRGKKMDHHTMRDSEKAVLSAYMVPPWGKRVALITHLWYTGYYILGFKL